MGIASGIFAAKGAKKAKKTTRKAGRRAREDLQLAFDEAGVLRDAARAEFDPFLSDDPGAALNQLRAASGAGGQQAQQEFFTSFEEGPQVEFLRERGLRGIDRAGAAGGNLGSGGRLAALTELSQGFALQSLNQQLNQLGSVATREQNIASALANQTNLQATDRLNLGTNTANIRMSTAAQVAQFQIQQAAATGAAIDSGIGLLAGGVGVIGGLGGAGGLFQTPATSFLPGISAQQQAFSQGAFPIGPIQGLP